MANTGEQGESFNFSSASRAANFRPDIDRVKRYDIYQRKYTRLTRIVQGVGVLMGAWAVRLGTTGHGSWAVVVVVLALLILLIGYMIGRGANASIYASGLLIPAHIVALEPLQLVALATMNNDEETTDEIYGIRRVTLTELPGHTLRVEERIPCAAGFGGSNLGGWGYFEPRPLVWATDDPAIIQGATEAIPDAEWNRLTQLTRRLPDLTDEHIAFYGADLTFIDVK